MSFILQVLEEAWRLLLESSVYVIFGLLTAGLLRMFLSPAAVARNFGQGRYSSVFKAAALGVPIPLCSCGVLPAAVSMKKQGANNGAVTAFLISTPESGVDSIALSYALLDPIMTVARPLSAFITAAAAGLAENVLSERGPHREKKPDLNCPVDGCCDGEDCPPEEHARHHTLVQKMMAGLRFAWQDVWEDMAAWYLIGLILAGLITVLVPAEVMGQYLGGGLASMLLMLAIGIPLYICATASTPIAAALILKGVSPGAALVFLLAGPATNVASLTVLLGVLGRRATVVYLSAIALFSVALGLLLDRVYASLALAPRALIGQAAEIMPAWAEGTGALFLLILSVGPVGRAVKSRWNRWTGGGGVRTEAPEAVAPEPCQAGSSRAEPT
ncbi:MAG: SO_0444 family Cu/Zn efflux transporter [Thermodesulfobacteriota bacterium]